jgi:hypothetical protein
MSLTGTMVSSRGEAYVREVRRLTNEPVALVFFHRVTQIRSRSGFPEKPKDGDPVTYSDGEWHSRYYSVRAGGAAELSEEIPIPPPKVRRGVEVRYRDQHWEKLTRKGWVPA